MAHVGGDSLDGCLMPHKCRGTFKSVRRDSDLIPVVDEDLTDHCPDGVLVIDHENRWRRKVAFDTFA